MLSTSNYRQASRKASRRRITLNNVSCAILLPMAKLQEVLLLSFQTRVFGISRQVFRSRSRPELTCIVINFEALHYIRPYFNACAISGCHLRYELDSGRDNVVSLLAEIYSGKSNDTARRNSITTTIFVSLLFVLVEISTIG